MAEIPHTMQFSGLAKCALFSSFIFAVAIWWVVAESDASAYSTRPRPNMPTTARLEEPKYAGGGRLRNTSPDARRARARNGTRQPGPSRKASAASQRAQELETRTQEIREAQTDPNSMFDMSNP